MPERRKEIRAERKKTGKAAKDIFAPTAGTTPAARLESAGPGRPVVHGEAWEKVTVVLLTRQIVFLDRLAADMRAKTGAAVKRAEIVRALVDALAESSIDLTMATGEADVKALLLARMAN
jgi:hypothetical protein